MKQNTRIARLVRNKRVKKLANFATVTMLICPLAIGAVNVLADTQESTESTSEVENVKVDETTEVKDAEIAEQTDAQTEKQKTTETSRDEVDKTIDTSQDKLATQKQSEAAESNVSNPLPEVQTKVSLDSGHANENLDWAEFDDLFTKLSALSESDYASVEDYRTADLFLENGATYYTSPTIDQWNLDNWVATMRPIYERAVGSTIPEEKVNVTINYVGSDNGTINTLTQEAIKGKPFTATAPDTFTQPTGPKFYRTSDASQTIESASEGAVITFNYEKIMATMNDVIVDGPNTAKVGDTVNYRMESTTYFNFGDPRIDYLEFEAGHPITISDPSAAEITAGSVKFLKAGTYTLAGAAVSEPFTVTVTDKDVTPPKPDPITKKHKVTINYVDENGKAIISPDILYFDDGKSGYVGHRRIDGYNVVADLENGFSNYYEFTNISKDETFTFKYKEYTHEWWKLSEILTVAKSFEDSKTYQFFVRHYQYKNNEDPTNFEILDNYGNQGIKYTLFSSNPADIIDGFNITFVGAGERTLYGMNHLGNIETSRIVNVSEKGTMTPDPDPTITSKEWIVTGTTSVKAGGVLEFGVTEKVTYSDGKVTAKTIILPAGYVFTSTDPTDKVEGNKVTFGKNEGKRTISLVTKARAGETIVGLVVEVTKDGKPVAPVDPAPEKPISPKPETGGDNGTKTPGTKDPGRATGKNGQKMATNNKNNSSKDLPQTGEKETSIMFLSGIVALGLMLVGFLFNKKEKMN